MIQNGSKLDIPQFGPTGVLHEDGSAEFGPVPTTAQPEDESSPPVPGKMRLEGWFVQQGSAMTFEGTYTFIADPDGCELDAPTRMTR